MTRIWWILIRALKSLKNLHLDWSLLCEVYNVWPKKAQRSYISWHWSVIQNLKKNWLVVWKITSGIWQSFIRTLENLKIGIFMGSFCPKEKMHELQTYRGFISNDTKEWWKIWRGIDLSFQSWHKEFDEFWLENSKVSKLYTLMCCFWPKYIISELKRSTKELYFMTPECDAKFEERLTCGLENEMRNLANFHQSTQNSQNWGFHWILLYKVENVWGELCIMTMTNDVKFEIKFTCHLKFAWAIQHILTRALKNINNFHFNVLILTKLYNVSAKKVQKDYVWLHSRLVQSLKENWLVFPKTDMRDLANFHQSTWTSPNWDIDGILLSKVETVWP